MSEACDGITQLPIPKRAERLCTCPLALHRWAMMFKLPNGKVIEIRTSDHLTIEDVFTLMIDLEDTVAAHSPPA